jgi:GTPase SAR1 family protein
MATSEQRDNEPPAPYLAPVTTKPPPAETTTATTATTATTPTATPTPTPPTKDNAKGSSNDDDGTNKRQPPTCVIVLGMAGSGKTTLMKRLNAHARQHHLQPYVINMDPAVREIPYEPNIDIRDTVDYKEVMKQYALGPNGAIMTSLNLFTTKIDEVVHLLEKRSDQLDFIFADTPGQIEVFTWSASGSIISQTLATSFPTVLLYVIDTPRTTNCTTFMSNMLYACSILYKMKLPFVIAFNKIDVADHTFAQDWMNDFESFQDAMDQQPSSEQSFYSSLIRSMSLVLDEFYANMRSVGVSAITGQGMMELFTAIGDAKNEYYENYLPELQKKVNEVRAKQNIQKDVELQKELEKERESLLRRTNAAAAATPKKTVTSTSSGETKTSGESSSSASPNQDALPNLSDFTDEQERLDYNEFMKELHGENSEKYKAAVAKGRRMQRTEE